MPAAPLEARTVNLIRERLHTAVLGDILDVIGLRHQFLPPQVRPLHPGVRMVGRAMTVQEEDNDDISRQFGKMFEALDQLGQGEIYLAAGGSGAYAMWGELMTSSAIARKAAGAVLVGPMRDTAAVRALGLPVFSTGSYAQDQRGRGQVVAYRSRLTIGRVVVDDGDIIVGDEDGVLVIPADRLDEVLERAVAKVGIEDEIGKRLARGESSQEMFDAYGVM